MSELNEIIDVLEIKFAKVIEKLEDLETSKERLALELAKSKAQEQQLKQAYLDLESRYDSLKLANSLLGSEENKRETKLKINSLIREIDSCISQISE